MLKKWVPLSNLCLYISVISSLFVSFFLSNLIYNQIKGYKQAYSDIVVGNITWSDYFKDLDYLFIISFILSFFILFPVFVRFCNTFLGDKEISIRYSDSLAHSLLSFRVQFIFFIAAYVLAVGLFSKEYSKGYLIGVLLLAIGTSIVINNLKTSKNKDVIFKNILSSSVLIFFATVGIITAYFYFSDSHNVQNLKHVPLIAVLVSWTFYLMLTFVKPQSFNYLFTKVNLISQLFLPLLLLNYTNGFYFYDNKLVKIIPKKTEIIIGSIIALFIMYQIFHLMKRRSTNLDHWESTISTPSLIAVSLAVLYSTPIASTLLYDDFHMGEILLPWQQIFHFKQAYNVDFVSVQGLLGMLYSGINSVLYDGTIASFNYSLMVIPALIGIIIISIISKLYGKQWGLLYSVIYLPIASSTILSRFYLVIPIMLILFHPKIQKKLCITLWLWLSALHCFYNPTVGTALTLAILPFMIFKFVEMLQSKQDKQYIIDHKKAMFLAIIVHLIIACLLISPIIGTITFLLDNASSNTQAYGVPFFGNLQIVPDWFPQWFNSIEVNRLVWEAIRVGGWLGSLLLLFILLFKSIGEQKSQSNREFTFFLISFIIFLFMVIPYSMGRIDPVSMNRSGSVSLFCISGLLPFLLIFKHKYRMLSLGTVIFLGFTVGLGSIFVITDYSKYVEKEIKPISVPSQLALVDGKTIGLSHLGTIFVDQNRLDELIRIKDTMDGLLQDGETFADLSNRSLLYYLLEKKVPSLYSADYLAANESIQEKMIKHLEKENPPVVFIGPSIRHDGGPSSLRSYRVYRWFLEQGYQFYTAKNLQFLLRADRYEQMGLNKPLNQIAELKKVFSQKDMVFIPSIWGRNYANMSNRFSEIPIKRELEHVNQITNDANGWSHIVGDDPYLTWRFSSAIRGMDVDFVAFTIELQEQDQQGFRFQVYWDQDGIIREQNSFYFNGNEGTFLLPMGSDPSWLLNENINYIRLDVDGLKEPFKIKNIKYLKLIR
ncbi:hypothetical protein [Paenibacillus sp. tmac-D7]|uniref:hypothetical protein n=1 Tax=Paenibacillus sp. tmac-D7 TaxID=2591462 RepID=UPI00114425D8|nr:hypothetical protein [Paenibacillus sp. tmac-D7]